MQTGLSTWVEDEPVIRYFDKTTYGGVVVRQDDFGAVFIPWHRINSIMVDDVLKTREVK
jgi:hypothetical protein